MRHGRTLWNAANRFQGQTDVPLSDEGRAQAQALAAVLRDETFNRAYSSDLSRARETAHIVLETHDVTIETDVRLREFDFGAWEGLTWNDIVERWPHLADREPTSARVYEPEGGETFAHVCARAKGFLDDLRARDAERIMVVTHAGFLHAVFAVLHDAFVESAPDPLTMRFAPASLSRLHVHGEHVRLITLNEVPDPSSALLHP